MAWFNHPSFSEMSTKNVRFSEGEFPNYWGNGNFENLTCLYHESGNGSHFQDIWDNPIHAYETDLLSHVCLNGSFSHLSRDEWNQRCLEHTLFSNN